MADPFVELFTRDGAPTAEAQGRALKEFGQALALEGAGQTWVDRTISLLGSWCVVRKISGLREFRFEEFRQFCAAQGWSSPKSSNVWGALPAIAARRGLIEFTGKYANAQSALTRNHPVKLWVAL